MLGVYGNKNTDAEEEGKTRPQSAASRLLSAPSEPLLRAHVDATNGVGTPMPQTPLPEQVLYFFMHFLTSFTLFHSFICS